MPLAACLYCGEVTFVSLWHHECEACFQSVIKPALLNGEKFQPVPGSLCSVLPERVKEREEEPA